MQRHGWTLLFHDCLIQQLRTLHSAAERARRKSPESASTNANVKLFGALSQLMMETIPSGPSRSEYRQGNTLGPAHRHWRRAKIGRRFRLFFRYDSTARVIIFAWVNDARTLRAAGSPSDPYAVFQKMLARGNPPDEWDELIKTSRQDWGQVP